MKALVVNCSRGHYNLGACKLADWLAAQGHEVERAEGDPGLFGARSVPLEEYSNRIGEPPPFRDWKRAELRVV